MTVKIKLTKGYEALVDEEDAERINAYKWYTKGATEFKPYARYDRTFNERRYIITMESLILGHKEGCIIDHIDGNSLNNTKQNLRFATIAENNYNRIRWSKSEIPYRGVYIANNDSKTASYRAHIREKGKLYRSKCTRNIHIAAMYYNILVLEHTNGFGIFNNVATVTGIN